MKHCVDCKYSKKEYVQVGPQAQMVYLCANKECADPVDASPFPCHVARQNIVFCGLEAKRFEAKSTEPPAPVVSLIQKA